MHENHNIDRFGLGGVVSVPLMHLLHVHTAFKEQAVRCSRADFSGPGPSRRKTYGGFKANIWITSHLLWFKRNFKQDLRCLAVLLYSYVFSPLSSRAEMASITVFTVNVCWNRSMEKGKLSAFRVCKANTASTCFSAASFRRCSMQKCGAVPGC